MLQFSLSQNLSLQQRMSPQLIQSLQLLQMATLDLQLEIKQQMEINPLLEEAEEEEAEEEEALGEDLQEESALTDDVEEVNWDALLEDQFEQNSYNNDFTEYDPNWEQDREPQANRITTVPPLLEQLRVQLGECALTGADVKIAEFIIGSIDDRGYLSCSTEEIAEALEMPLQDVERVLAVIQTFDPPGIGAQDLKDCLMIQLEQREEAQRDLALQIVRHHMEDLTQRRLCRITRALGITSDELKEALNLIERLQPSPGAISISDYSGLLTLDTEVPYVTPDLIVEKAGEDWVVSLTNANLPSLRINGSYVKLLKDGKRGKDEIRTYVSKKLNDARWLINAINQRRSTMMKVANYLVTEQINWFENGPAHLKPMVLQDAADAVDMHVSTISRVSNGKYMQTPHGVFELKYFFDSKVQRNDGEDVSARSVKKHITELIAEEDKAQPMSDQKIAEVLRKEGLKIARRTVAKYRDQLGINAQRYRKAFF